MSRRLARLPAGTQEAGFIEIELPAQLVAGSPANTNGARASTRRRVPDRVSSASSCAKAPVPGKLLDLRGQHIHGAALDLVSQIADMPVARSPPRISKLTREAYGRSDQVGPRINALSPYHLAALPQEARGLSVACRAR